VLGAALQNRYAFQRALLVDALGRDALRGEPCRKPFFVDALGEMHWGGERANREHQGKLILAHV
jgi:hypothetical protein